MDYSERFEKFENARIIHKNFSGDPTKNYNGNPGRMFCIVIDDYDRALELNQKGLNVKEKTNQDGEKWWFLSGVHVDYRFDDSRKPTVVMIMQTIDGNVIRRNLDEETVGILDFQRIISADIVIATSNKGAAYLRTMYVTVQDTSYDPFREKYKDISFGTDSDDTTPF